MVPLSVCPRGAAAPSLALSRACPYSHCSSWRVGRHPPPPLQPSPFGRSIARRCLSSQVCHGRRRLLATGAVKSRSESAVWTLSADDLAAVAERGLLEPGGVYGPGNPLSDLEHLAEALRTSATRGLCESEAELERRADDFGRNTLPASTSLSFLELLWEALQDVTLYALIASGIFSLVTGYFVGGEGGDSGSLEGAAILASVAVVVLVTAVNDYQKESQFQELSAAKEEVQVRVIRNGTQITLSNFDLLVGDLMVVEGGDILAADCVLSSGSMLKVDESHLTGESEDVIKDAVRTPIILSGSKVSEGSAQAIVIAVGSKSQSGVISLLATEGQSSSSDAEAPSDGMRKTTLLQSKLEVMASNIGRFGLGAALLTWLLMSTAFSWDTFVVGHSSWSWDYLSTYLDFLINGITVLVVAVPEGLPLAVTLALAFSVKKMLQENNLVRQLDACETMGCATTILTDKTGTLTQNRMTAVELWAGGRSWNLLPGADGADGAAVRADGNGASPHSGPLGGAGGELRTALVEAIALNTTASYIPASEAGEGGWVGSQTEGALLELALLAGYDALDVRKGFTTTSVLPFSSQRKCMGSLAVRRGDSPSGGEGGRLYVKGAPDVLLRKCTRMMQADGALVPMPDAESLQLGDSSLRVIALAFKDGGSDHGWSSVDICGEDSVLEGLVLVGLVGLQDPIRPEVPSAIRQCQKAGITVRMLTGDNASTGASIARQVGILEADDGPDAVMDAQRFNDLVTRADGSADVDAFARMWPQVRVLARCTPTHKFEIVKKLQATQSGPGLATSGRREVLAMTGDGTNDAPALRAADVGFGMNGGTSIAKAASDIVILDDSFSSIVSAVRWGRNVYISITKFLQFQLSINIVAVGITVLGAAVLHRSPLGAVQMLWVNLIMDSLASLALATELPTDALLELPPFSAEAPLITNKVLKHICGQAAYQMVALVGLLATGGPLLGLDIDDPQGQAELFTVVFNSLVQMSLFNQINCRRVGDEVDVLEGLANNEFFLYIIGGEFLLQWAIVQYGGELFKTVALDYKEWGLCVALGAGTMLVRRLLVELADPKLVKEA
mmetsp:Transcript_5817/g.15174  ORF Transcript_5817/g.15174 Transcript_5817/m.15174 type:complete len:1075 (-) Transcript_5817:70-3294(-)